MEINSSLVNFGQRNRLLLLIMRTFIFLLCTTVFAFSPKLSLSQERVTIDMDKQVSVDEVFALIKEQTDYSFIYQKGMFDKLPVVQLKKGVIRVTTLLRRSLPQTEFNYIVTGDNTILIKKRSQSQQRQVSGTVTDETGAPIPNISVLLKGTTRGVATDFDGVYSITVPDLASVLVFSALGFETQEITVGNQTTINVTMEESVSQLDEVVVSTGYFEVKERLNTGNIEKVESKIIAQQPVVNPLQALSGRIAGVQIQETSGTPGSAINIRIRGLNSLNNGQLDGNGVRLPNSNLPFYVIDGVPVTSSSLNTSDLRLPNGNPLAAIQPGDIESIEVLKDADATAIYGSRGANGVVLITTKRGKAGKTRISLDYSNGYGEVPYNIDLLNTEQYIEMRTEGAINSGFFPLTGFESFYPDLLEWDTSRYTNWQDELVRSSQQQRTNVTISGGSQETQFLISGSHLKQSNLVKYDDGSFRSISGHMNLSHTSKNQKFKSNLSATFTSNTNNQTNIDIIREVIRTAPNAPELFDSSGNLNWENNTFDNPLASLGRDYENRTRNFVANATLNYLLFPNLRFNASLGYTNMQVYETSINPVSSRRPDRQIGATGSSNFADNRIETWIVEPTITYEKLLGQGNLTVLFGGTFQESIQEGERLFASGYTTDVLLRDLNAAATVEVGSSNYTQYRYNGFYGQLNYRWKNKYILNLTGRRDGSSRFGPGKRFGNFGAIGGAWVFSEEGFAQKTLPVLSFGKIRASYGLTGNDQVQDYGYLNSYTVTAFPYNAESGLQSTRLANPEYSWETVKKLETGLEIGIFKNRLTIGASWFRNRTSDQLIGRPLPLVTGFSSVLFNLPAIVENRGLEFELGATLIKSKGFTWSTNANLTRARNELLEFPNIEGFPGFDNILKVGSALTGTYRYESLGVNRESGTYDFVDFNGDGRITRLDDRQNFVVIEQDFFGGINNSISFKGLQLDVFFSFAKQNAFRTIYGDTWPGSVFISNQSTNVLNRWQAPGDVTNVQAYSAFGLNQAWANNVGSDNNIVDASYIQLKNIALSWQIPVEYIEKLGLSSARIYSQAQNLFTFSDYEGDPESQTNGTPPLRMITTGIQLSF